MHSYFFFRKLTSIYQSMPTVKEKCTCNFVFAFTSKFLQNIPHKHARKESMLSFLPRTRNYDRWIRDVGMTLNWASGLEP